MPAQPQSSSPPLPVMIDTDVNSHSVYHHEEGYTGFIEEGERREYNLVIKPIQSFYCSHSK